MKRYWLFLFLLSIILFQFYLFSWNKTQLITHASQQNSLVNASIFSAPSIATICNNYILYPHAAVIQNQHTNSLSLTHDSAYNVTNWYLNTLVAKDFSILSNIADTTHGINAYMLVAEKNIHHISIIVERGSGENTTTIFIRDNSC